MLLEPLHFYDRVEQAVTYTGGGTSSVPSLLNELLAKLGNRSIQSKIRIEETGKVQILRLYVSIWTCKLNLTFF